MEIMRRALQQICAQLGPLWVLAVSKRFTAWSLTGLGAVAMRGFAGSNYALIAAMSGRMPMMFITRVRL